MESTVLVESVVWHEGGGEQKAGVPLGAMGFTSLSSGENSWQAQPRTGILCNWRNCSIQQSFSTDMEDQEKQRNSTDKNRTVSTCSDTLFQRRSSQCWRGESLILECLLVYSTLKSKYKRNLINSLYTAITWQMFVLWFHMTALTEITCHSGKKVRAHFSFPFIFPTPPAFLWCLSSRSRGRN